MTTVLRTTARLDEAEVAFAAKLRNPKSVESEALRELTGYEDMKHAPAATLIHALIEAGITAVKDKAVDVAYQRAAIADRDDPERQTWRRAMRNRRGYSGEAGSSAA